MRPSVKRLGCPMTIGNGNLMLYYRYVVTDTTDDGFLAVRRAEIQVGETVEGPWRPATKEECDDVGVTLDPDTGALMFWKE